MNVTEYLKKQGYQTIGDAYYSHIDNWLNWYQGKAKFHKYTVYNGRNRRTVTRKTMGMAKKVAEDWADLILNERVDINTGDSAFDSGLAEIFRKNKFRFRGNQLIELAFALGTGATVEYLDENGMIIIDYIRANMIFPLSWDNGEIVECAFAGQRIIKGKECYYINMHVLENGKYIVKNRMVDASSGKDVDLPEGLLSEVATGSARPRFQIYQPNIVNNVDLDCPMGISVYANAVDNLMHCDLVFDSYNNEFQLGKKRILVPTTMTRVALDQAGATAPIFDDNDTVFYALSVSGDSKIDKPVEINMELRADAHEKAINTALSLLSDKCGLGPDRYEYQSSSGVKTATEVVSEDSDLFQTLKKHEMVIEQALIDLVLTIAEMSGVKKQLDVTISFDDSIIQDTDAIRQQAMLEFNSGLIDEVEYWMRVYNLSEEAAIKKVAEIKARQAPPPDDTDPTLIDGQAEPGPDDGADA